MTPGRSRREVSTVDPTLTGTVLTVLAVLAAGAWRLHTLILRRALDRERAAAALTDGARHRDIRALTERLHTARDRRAVLAAADAALDEALAAYAPRTDPHQEGGSP